MAIAVGVARLGVKGGTEDGNCRFYVGAPKRQELLLLRKAPDCRLSQLLKILFPISEPTPPTVIAADTARLGASGLRCQVPKAEISR